MKSAAHVGKEGFGSLENGKSGSDRKFMPSDKTMRLEIAGILMKYYRKG